MSDGGWIDCRERMPDVEQICLIRTTEPRYAIARLGCRKDTFWEEGRSIDWRVREVSHWQPITPPAAKGGESNG